MISKEDERQARSVIRAANKQRAEARPKREPKPLGSEPGEATPRKRLTRGEREMLLHRQGGFCGCGCTRTLFNENDPRIWWAMIDEHVLPLELGGSNDLSNRALYLVECAKRKTKDDIRRIAKAKRQATMMQPRAPAKHPIRSRGFG